MTQIAIIVFREILEIALILSVLFGATKGMKNRALWINYGLAIGIIGSIIFAALTDKISESFSGNGQEIFTAAILFLASLMIGYTVIWMKHHSRTLSKNLKNLGKSVIDGEKSLYALLLIVSLSVLREGIEIVLFTYSYYMSGIGIYELLFGAIIGLSCGLIAGFAFYFGLLTSLGKYFFTATTTILAFVSAGLMAKSLSYLANAGIVSEIKFEVWDTSNLISDEGFFGIILNVLTGYVAKPSAIQLIGYFATLILIFIMIRIIDKKYKK